MDAQSYLQQRVCAKCPGTRWGREKSCILYKAEQLGECHRIQSEWKHLLKDYGWMKKALPLLIQREEKQHRESRAQLIESLQNAVSFIEWRIQQLDEADRRLFDALTSGKKLKEVATDLGLTRSGLYDRRERLIKRLLLGEKGYREGDI